MLEDPCAPWDWSHIRHRCLLEALRVLRRRDDAEDVVQEAMARAWRSRRSCRTPDAPLAWCLQITRNEAFRLLDRRRMPGRADANPHEEVPDPHSAAIPERTDERIDVRRAISSLAHDEKLLIALRYECDYSHPQIADWLDIPAATARVRLHRAHKRLELILKAS